MRRKKIAAGNWKMNTTVPEGVKIVQDLGEGSFDISVDIVICAPATHLDALNQLELPKNILFGAQNMYHETHGAYTGEIGAPMLQSIGITHVILGHSERREYFNESNEMLGKKLRTALDHELIPIFCCGESLAVRNAGAQNNHVIRQLKESFGDLEGSEIAEIIIAYEPIWAIGTGETATPEQAQEMHCDIREFLRSEYGSDVADYVPILYGGSVKPANAKDIFAQEDVDGGLVGGASLKVDSFAAIVNSF